MSSHTNRLKNRQPKPDEIAKAVVLSSMAYLDNQEATAAVETRYSDIGFARIVMAQHFLLAFDPNTTLYVAFRKRLSIQDMFAVKVAGRSEFIESYGDAAEDVEGLYHSGLFEIITSELPRMSHFQHYHAKRIIFSGHGLAGALAHLFLICYMIKTREEDRKHISIGFGSPYFCDNAAKLFCQKTMELDRRMFTFVNATDPVPRILESIRMTCNPESLGRRAECCCLERLNTWLGSGNSDEGREITISLLKPVQTILNDMGRIGQFRMPYYEPVGVYRNTRESTRRGSGLFSLNGLWEFAFIYINRIMSMDVALDADSWECNRIESYVKEFASYTNIGRFPIKPILEIKPNPCIHACTLSVYNSCQTSYEGVITIKGSDLSNDCCGEPNVEPNVGHEWTVEDTSETKCLLVRGFLTEIEADVINFWKNKHLIHLS